MSGISRAMQSAIESQIKNSTEFQSFKQFGDSLKNLGSSVSNWCGSSAQSISNYTFGSNPTGLMSLGWDIFGSEAGSLANKALNNFIDNYFDKLFGSGSLISPSIDIFETLEIPQSSGTYSSGWSCKPDGTLSSGKINVSYEGYSGAVQVDMDGKINLSAGVNLTYQGDTINNNTYLYSNIDNNGNYSVGGYSGGSGKIGGHDFSYGAGFNYEKEEGFRTAISFKLKL